MRNILVTGAGGFVAKYVIQELKKQNYYVVGIDRVPIDSMADVLFVLNISSESFVDDFMEHIGNLSIDAIIHLAAEIDMSNTESLIRSNCIGMYRMIQLAEHLQVERFVYLSSIPIIGLPLYVPIDEQHSINPPSVYHTTKYMGEIMLTEAAERGLDAVTLRIASPIGRRKSQVAFLGYLLNSCCKNTDISLHGCGGRIQNYIDARDIAIAVAKALIKGRGLYLIKGKDSISNKALADLCIQLSGSNSKVVFSGCPDVDEDKNWTINGEKAERELEYTPMYSIEDSIMWILGETE